MADSYDVIVIGGGPAGYPAAIRAGAEQAQGGLHRRVEEPRRQQCLRRHLPERGLHSLEGAAGILRALSSRADEFAVHGIKRRQRRARSGRDAEAPGGDRQGHDRRHRRALQGRRRHRPAGHGTAAAGSARSRSPRPTAQKRELERQARRAGARARCPIELKIGPVRWRTHRRFLGRARVRRGAEAARRHRRRRHRARARQRLAPARQRGHDARGAAATSCRWPISSSRTRRAALQEAGPRHPPGRQGDRRHGRERGASTVRYTDAQGEHSDARSTSWWSPSAADPTRRICWRRAPACSSMSAASSRSTRSAAPERRERLGGRRCGARTDARAQGQGGGRDGRRPHCRPVLPR